MPVRPTRTASHLFLALGAAGVAAGALSLVVGGAGDTAVGTGLILAGLGGASIGLAGVLSLLGAVLLWRAGARVTVGAGAVALVCFGVGVASVAIGQARPGPLTLGLLTVPVTLAATTLQVMANEQARSRPSAGSPRHPLDASSLSLRF